MINDPLLQSSVSKESDPMSYYAAVDRIFGRVTANRSGANAIRTLGNLQGAIGNVDDRSYQIFGEAMQRVLTVMNQQQQLMSRPQAYGMQVRQAAALTNINN